VNYAVERTFMTVRNVVLRPFCGARLPIYIYHEGQYW